MNSILYFSSTMFYACGFIKDFLSYFSLQLNRLENPSPRYHQAARHSTTYGSPVWRTTQHRRTRWCTIHQISPCPELHQAALQTRTRTRSLTSSPCPTARRHLPSVRSTMRWPVGRWWTRVVPSWVPRSSVIAGGWLERGAHDRTNLYLQPNQKLWIFGPNGRLYRSRLVRLTSSNHQLQSFPRHHHQRQPSEFMRRSGPLVRWVVICFGCREKFSPISGDTNSLSSAVSHIDIDQSEKFHYLLSTYGS